MLLVFEYLSKTLAKGSNKICIKFQSFLNTAKSKPKKTYFQPHPYFFYQKTPNSAGVYPSNWAGYVGKKVLKKKKKTNIFRIFVVGGSTVEQINEVNDPNSHWPAQLEKYCNAYFKGYQIEVINAGCSGYTSAESFIEFCLKGIEFKPDLLIIYHNVNDAWTAQMVDNFESDYSHARISKKWNNSFVSKIPSIPWLYCYEALRGFFLQKLGKHQSLIEQIADLPFKSKEKFKKEKTNPFQRNIKNLIIVAQSEQIQPVIIRFEMSYKQNPWTLQFFQKPSSKQLFKKLIKYIETNNKILKYLSYKYKCPYINLGRFPEKYFYDGIHFNSKGLNTMAKRVFFRIVPTIKILAKKTKRLQQGK